MKLDLRKHMTAFFVLFSLYYAAAGHPQDAEVASFPSRPITYILPLPAGAPVDFATRLLAKEAEKFLGQPVLVVNRPGAALTIGAAAIAAAKPDGYTVGYTGPSAMFVVPFSGKLPYHPLKDFQQIMQWASMNFGVSVRANSPFKTFKDIVEHARQNPKTLTYGTTGDVSVQFLIMAQIARRENVQLTQIPYKGGSQVEIALLGGHIDLGASEFSASQIDAGQIRLLLLFRDERSSEYPQTPVLKDLGYGDIDAPMFMNVAGPAGLPPAIARKLEDAFSSAIKTPAFIKGIKDIRWSIVHRNSKEMTEYMARNYENYGKQMKEMGFAK